MVTSRTASVVGEWVRPLVLAAVACLAMFATAGCSTARESRDFTFVYLKTGPARSSFDDSQLQEVFKGHMANMHRLADAKRLLIAGPFEKPADPTWRGIFVLNTGNEAEAEAWVGTDPGVQKGVFSAERWRLKADASTLEIARLEREFQATRVGDKSDTPQIRPYVMVTAPDAAAFEEACAKTPPSWRVVWCGRFAGSKGGVFVIDAAEPEPVRAWVEMNLGSHWPVDGWYATPSLLTLPPACGRLP